jgi:hypothetical protein
MKLPKHQLLLPLAFLLSNCASIVDGGSDKSIQINSNPPGAKVTITDKKGKEVAVTTTPSRVNLKRNRGPYVGETYTMRFQAPGYHPSETQVKSTMNGWYVGNLVFGGLLGILIIDPCTGALFTLSPREVERNLIPISSSSNTADLAAADARANPPVAALKPKKTSGFNR